MLTKSAASVAVGLIASVVWLGGSRVQAQAIAYEPIPGQALTGSTLGVTPVVSADRRYVRLGVDAFFNNVNGFSNFSVPGAVSGGGSGNFNAGMNGVIGPVGVGASGGDMSSYGYGVDVGAMRAGPFPIGASGSGGSFSQGDDVMGAPRSMLSGWPVGEFDEFQDWPVPASRRAKPRTAKQRGTASSRAAARQRRPSRKAATQETKAIAATPSADPAQ